MRVLDTFRTKRVVNLAEKKLRSPLTFRTVSYGQFSPVQFKNWPCSNVQSLNSISFRFRKKILLCIFFLLSHENSRFARFHVLLDRKLYTQNLCICLHISIVGSYALSVFLRLKTSQSKWRFDENERDSVSIASLINLFQRRNCFASWIESSSSVALSFLLATAVRGWMLIVASWIVKQRCG